MKALDQILHKLREHGYIYQRRDYQWRGNWDNKIIPVTTMRAMEDAGYIELGPRKRHDGSIYYAYVISALLTSCQDVSRNESGSSD